MPLPRRALLRSLLAPFPLAVLPSCSERPAPPSALPPGLEGALGGPSLRRGHALRDGETAARRQALPNAPTREVD
ncbi:MAG: hypothetical protein AAGH15_23615, partial [Myxococcota bacterium]